MFVEPAKTGGLCLAEGNLDLFVAPQENLWSSLRVFLFVPFTFDGGSVFPKWRITGQAQQELLDEGTSCLEAALAW